MNDENYYDYLKFNRESLLKSAKTMKKLIDGEPKNINPLKEIPISKMRLYMVDGEFFSDARDAVIYCGKINELCESIKVVDYFDEMADRYDVIRVIDFYGKESFYHAYDVEHYASYNFERSIYRGEFVWESQIGSLGKYYSAFRERGISFENDVYLKYEQRLEFIKKLSRNRLFK